MITATDLGQFIVEISDDPIDEPSARSARPKGHSINECERDSAKQVRDERSECERNSAKQVRDEALVASIETVSKDNQTIVIRVRSCFELEEILSRLVQSGYDPAHRTVVIPNLLDAFYDTSILTREAAQSLGRVKSLLELVVENGIQVVALCRRRSDDLGTRSHFMASLCASADQVHLRRRT